MGPILVALRAFWPVSRPPRHFVPSSLANARKSVTNIPQPMNTLPIHHTKHGWRYKLVERNDCAAIYSQSMHPDLPANGKASAYEVVILRLQAPRHTGKFNYDGGETLPTDEQWGQLGWTCHTLERAREKLAEVSTPERIEAANRVRQKLANEVQDD